MNSLSTLDRYLLNRWKGSNGNTRTPSRRGSAAVPPVSLNGSSHRREQVVVPDSVLASTEPVLAPGHERSSTGECPPIASVTRTQPKRRLTGYPSAVGSTSTDTGSSSNSEATSLGNNVPGNQRRRKRPRGQGRRVPPRKRNRNPEEGWMTAGFVGVLGLWSDLWTVIFGPDEEDLVNGKDGRLSSKHDDRLKGKGREDEVSATSASETETEEKQRGRRRGGRGAGGEMDGGWVDPVTRAPDDPEELLRQATEAEMLSSNGTAVATPEKLQAVARRSSPQLVSFQLGKKISDQMADHVQPSTRASDSESPLTSSILTNSSSNARRTLPTLLPTIQSTHASGNTSNILIETRRQPPADGVIPPRNTKLLPAPLSVPLSASSASSKRRDQLTGTAHSQHQPTISITSIPRSLSTTPFHRPKTLILDLDETLIHSTSRPMSMQSSGMGSGSGIMGISLSGLFSGGKHQRGGGGARGEGHVVEVVLGGRSTLYHVYKRPYVDHFLKKVSGVAGRMGRLLICVLGVFMVYPGDLYGEHARIRGSRHRLARWRSRLLCQETVPRGKSEAVHLDTISLCSSSSHAPCNPMDRIPRTCHSSRKTLAESASWTIHPSAITGTKAGGCDAAV